MNQRATRGGWGSGQTRPARRSGPDWPDIHRRSLMHSLPRRVGLQVRQLYRRWQADHPRPHQRLVGLRSRGGRGGSRRGPLGHRPAPPRLPATALSLCLCAGLVAGFNAPSVSLETHHTPRPIILLCETKRTNHASSLAAACRLARRTHPTRSPRAPSVPPCWSPCPHTNAQSTYGDSTGTYVGTTVSVGAEYTYTNLTKGSSLNDSAVYALLWDQVTGGARLPFTGKDVFFLLTGPEVLQKQGTSEFCKNFCGWCGPCVQPASQPASRLLSPAYRSACLPVCCRLHSIAEPAACRMPNGKACCEQPMLIPLDGKKGHSNLDCCFTGTAMVLSQAAP
jgi:hypothetical protein